MDWIDILILNELNDLSKDQVLIQVLIQILDQQWQFLQNWNQVLQLENSKNKFIYLSILYMNFIDRDCTNIFEKIRLISEEIRDQNQAIYNIKLKGEQLLLFLFNKKYNQQLESIGGIYILTVFNQKIEAFKQQ
ncbi:unnamed protein product [Paramecium octaurelia]|uniref:Uncharacterized protein n=1 Tax=Paramecium octaurelia TaxID=43137 RepID=A0A8S1SG38_PAROT|nr:unnamed protein product [Paramecium octaurelia]